MTNNWFNATHGLGVFPETETDLAELAREQDDFEGLDGLGADNYGISIRDEQDITVLVGTLEELEETLTKFRAQLIKLRRYDKSLKQAKAKLEGRLRG